MRGEQKIIYEVFQSPHPETWAASLNFFSLCKAYGGTGVKFRVQKQDLFQLCILCGLNKRVSLALDLPRALGGVGMLSWQPCSQSSELRVTLLVTLLAKARLTVQQVPAMVSSQSHTVDGWSEGRMGARLLER